MAESIKESGMTFGPFSEENLFYIEKSQIYNKLHEGLQIAEFLLLQPNKNSLYVVEAKSTSPNPENLVSEVNFNKYITEISDKLLNALTLGFALALNRHEIEKQEIPTSFKEALLKKTKILLVLVIRKHKEIWLQPISLALNKHLRMAIKTWPLQVTVLNAELAKNQGLITDY